MKGIVGFLLLTFFWSVHADLKVGAERLTNYLPLLKDQRVAIMVNQSSLVKEKHLVDVLLENQVNIKSILTVEHGFRGKLGAGEKVTIDLLTVMNVHFHYSIIIPFQVIQSLLNMGS